MNKTVKATNKTVTEGMNPRLMEREAASGTSCQTAEGFSLADLLDAMVP